MDKSDSKEFLRSQVAAFISTCVDYLTVITLTEIAGLWYIYSNVFGALLGAITNFSLGRHWTIKAQTGAVGNQAFKYALVSLGSVCLNTFGLFALKEWGNVNYIVAKIIVGILIAVCFNYVLQKHFVFK